MRKFSLVVSLLCLGLSQPAIAWESNLARGPVRSSDNLQSSVRLIVPRKSPTPHSIGEGVQTTAAAFSRRTITYPANEGVTLGHGWDFLTNRKTFSSCVDFTPLDDRNYQDANLSFQEVTDDETLNVTLNAEFSGSVSGTIDDIGAKAKATTTIDASHSLASTDLNIVAHTSIESGVSYASPPTKTSPSGSRSISLLPEMAQLAKSDPETFRSRCGDGFVATIGYGADLYLLLHFHSMNSDDKLAFSFLSSASASLADVFSADGSSNLRTTVEQMVKKSQLDITYVQNGGKIDKIPTNLIDARTTISMLAKSENAGSRPIYVVIAPYSDLPEWDGFHWLDNSSIQQLGVRYYQRLSSAYFELMNIRENYFRDRSRTIADPSYVNISPEDSYYYDYRHNLRTDSLSNIGSAIWNEIMFVDAQMKILSSDKCRPAPVATVISAGLSTAAQKTAREVIAKGVSSLISAASTCQIAANDLSEKTDHFNDFRFWALFPVPINALSEKSIETLDEQATATLAQRKAMLTDAIFSNWVERIDQVRCRLFFECLTIGERAKLHEEIASSFNGASFTVSMIKDRVCFNNEGCLFSCDDRGLMKQKIAGVCAARYGGYRAPFTQISDDPGGHCGTATEEFTCSVYQPSFP